MRRNVFENLSNPKIPKPSNVLTVGKDNCPFSSISSAVLFANSGDMILVYPGSYVEQIILKDNVNLFCMPGVSISSDNINGTIIDNNQEVQLSLKGFPIITNSNGLNKRIVLQNANSSVNDFWWELEGIINASSVNLASWQKIFHNTLGGVPTFGKDDIGCYWMLLNGAFPENKMTGYIHNYGSNSVLHLYFDGGGDSIIFETSPPSDSIPHARIYFKVFP